jgi:hypothetical protein
MEFSHSRAAFSFPEVKIPASRSVSPTTQRDENTKWIPENKEHRLSQGRILPARL